MYRYTVSSAHLHGVCQHSNTLLFDHCVGYLVQCVCVLNYRDFQDRMKPFAQCHSCKEHEDFLEGYQSKFFLLAHYLADDKKHSSSPNEIRLVSYLLPTGKGMYGSLFGV